MAAYWGQKILHKTIEQVYLNIGSESFFSQIHTPGNFNPLATDPTTFFAA